MDLFSCMLLPDDLHCLWTLPDGDHKPAEYPILFKEGDLVVFSKMEPLDSTNLDYGNAGAAVRGERGRTCHSGRLV